MIRQYKSGRVERLLPVNPVPPSVDAATGVASKDVTLDPGTGLGRASTSQYPRAPAATATGISP